MGAESGPEGLLAASPDAVIVVGPDGTIRSAAGAVGALFGYRPDELVGRPIETLVPIEARDRHREHRARYAAEPRSRGMGVGMELSGRRRDGSTFPVDVSLAPIELDGSPAVGAFVRDASARRRSAAVLTYVNEISQALLARQATGKILVLVAERARSLVGAATSWIVVPAAGGRLRVAAARGRGADQLVGATLDAGSSLSARAMAGGDPVVVPDMTAEPAVLPEARALGLGPGIYVPLSTEGGAVGALAVARSADDLPFETADVSTALVFASAAGVVLALGEARAELEAAEMTAEHERIARDLHDTVIQHLFAIGMGLQGVRRQTDPAVAERIDQAVDALDSVIRDIRETIFDLSRAPEGQPDLRQRVREVVASATAQLGFAPHVTYRGPVATAVGDEVAGHLLAVLREALSNTARHAGASRVEVTLRADESTVSLLVVDDGVGISSTPGAGHGLANMAHRAQQLAGTLSVEPGAGGGIRLEWRVPLGG